MFGTNPIRKAGDTDPEGQMLAVQSIFPTIQGEGPFSGTACVFVRLSGCNLRCTFCDTDFESKRKQMAVGYIGDQVYEASMMHVTRPSARSKLVVISGGEPLLQNVLPLVGHLVHSDYHVQFETAGTVWVDGLEDYIKTGHVTLVCSPKTGRTHPAITLMCNHWKYLIRNGHIADEDGLPIGSTQNDKQHNLVLMRPPKRPGVTVWLQPCEEYVVGYKQIVVDRSNEPPEDAPGSDTPPDSDQQVTGFVRDEEKSQANLRLVGLLAMTHNYRISLQTHKYIQLP